jgi:uncharacterized protein (TIGR02118 family)
MVRLLVLYGTPTDTAAFDKHYADVHIPLAKKIPNLIRYTLSRNLTMVAGDPPLYLVAELDFADMPTAQAALQSPGGHAAARDVHDNLAPICPAISNLLYEVAEA